MNFISIPALEDNYIWLLHNDDSQCLVVDLGEAAPVLRVLADRHLIPIAILLTYHHDHVGSVAGLMRHFTVPIYGPEEARTKGATRIVSEGDTLNLLGHTFSIMSCPVIRLGHIGFYGAPWLFSGDTVFPQVVGGFSRARQSKYVHVFSEG